MIGAPAETNGASAISSVPTAPSASADHAHTFATGRLLRLHSMPASAMNHTSTDKSTCTTSATRKKSATGSQRLTPGVREITSSSE